jgi:integrase
LLFLYSGWRISELLDLKTANVDLKAGTMLGGTKTKSGKGRIVPIHSKVAEMVQKRVSEGGEHLFMYNDRKCDTTRYYDIWNDIMESVETAHTPHECRHTFRSALDSSGANKVCIDLMMGHKSKDVGERIYTHKVVSELKEAIELITY